MPHYAHFGTDLHCPACGAPVTTPSGVLWFQWGYCPSYQPLDQYIYSEGEPVRWQTCADGTTPAWTFFHDPVATMRTARHWGGSNIRNPAVRNLLAQDLTQFYRLPEEEPHHCATCGQVLAGAIVEIRDGRIARAWVYRPGEFDPAIAYYLLAPDGTPVPIEEWGYHSMSTRSDC